MIINIVNVGFSKDKFEAGARTKFVYNPMIAPFVYQKIYHGTYGNGTDYTEDADGKIRRY